MKKYSWNFNKDEEAWDNDTFDTIEECIANAKAINDDYCETVYIGENRPFIPGVDAESVLEQIEEEAYEFARGNSENWDVCDRKKHEELNELSKTLTDAVTDWMKKYGYMPDFCRIKNIKPYPLNRTENGG